MTDSRIAWIRCADRMPTKRDADVYGCVVAWHMYNGLMVTGWHRIRDNQFITAWAKTPKGPEEVADG